MLSSCSRPAPGPRAEELQPLLGKTVREVAASFHIPETSLRAGDEPPGRFRLVSGYFPDEPIGKQLTIYVSREAAVTKFAFRAPARTERCAGECLPTCCNAWSRAATRSPNTQLWRYHGDRCRRPPVQRRHLCHLPARRRAATWASTIPCACGATGSSTPTATRQKQLRGPVTGQRK